MQEFRYFRNQITNKMKKALLLFSLTIFYGESMANQDPDWDRIQFILDKQIECWNNADLECFMEAYWKSDSLKFIGRTGVVFGWGPTLERYKTTYPDQAAMGQLSFEILTAEKVGLDGYYVVGKFKLARGELADLSGYFSLLWRKVRGEWKIVSDHTS